MAWSSRWRARVGALGGLVLGGVFLVAAVTKAADPLAFAEQIHAEGLDALLPAETMALIGLGLELVLGMSLVLGLRRLWILIPSSGLVALFVFLTARGYWRFAQGIVDETVSCGCFGNLVDRSPVEAFWQDLLLLVPALAAAHVARPRGALPFAREVVVALVTLVGLAFAHVAPDLPLDDLATRLRPGKLVKDICSGSDGGRICLTGIVPDLAQGEHVVVLADLGSEDFGKAVPALNAYTAKGQGPALWVLSSAAPEAHHRFFWRWAPTFQVTEAPPALLRPLYRTLPRSFLVRDGRVARTFSGLPPLRQ